MQIAKPLNEAWSHFRRRMPPDALLLLEGGGSQPDQVDETPSNMILEIEDDGDRARAQIAKKRKQRGEARPQMLPSFEDALSNRGDTARMPGRVMSVGEHSEWSPQGVTEEAEPQLLLEG